MRKRTFKEKKNILEIIKQDVFPFLQRNAANQILRKKISAIGDELNLDDDNSALAGFDNPDNANIDVLISMVEDNRHRMERLEDKAKIQIAGITIAISIIFGFAGKEIIAANEHPVLRWIIYPLIIVAVLYMASAGLLAIRLLTNQNVFFYSPKNLDEMDDRKKRRSLNAVIAKNQIQNTIRSNEIYTSYAYMRNAIILLVILFAIWVCPAVH